eukprot:s1722_g5.t1
MLVGSTAESPSLPSGNSTWLAGEASDMPFGPSSEAPAPIAAARNVVAYIGSEAAVAGAQQGDPKETWEKWQLRENLLFLVGFTNNSLFFPPAEDGFTIYGRVNGLVSRKIYG